VREVGSSTAAIHANAIVKKKERKKEKEIDLGFKLHRLVMSYKA
jgi:hypothetical protein